MGLVSVALPLVSTALSEGGARRKCDLAPPKARRYARAAVSLTMEDRRYGKRIIRKRIG